MYAYLHGTIVHKGERPSGGQHLIVDVGGIGYDVLTSSRSFDQAVLNTTMQVFTSLIVREDLMQLVGFITREERDMFDLLSTASGVGPKVALSLMSALSVSEIASALMAEDAKRLSQAKGVGPKLAQKLAIELKDKLTKWRLEKWPSATLSTSPVSIPQSQAIDEAQTVLLSLGYSVEEIQESLAVLSASSPDLATMTSEAVLQQILKWLATQTV